MGTITTSLQFRLILVLLFIVSGLNAQQFISFDIENVPDSLISHDIRISKLLEIDENDIIIDVGAGKMDYSLDLANQYPNNKFYFEDIDSTYCNYKQLNKTISVRGLKNVKPANINIVIGNENSTTLGENSVDIIILQATLHLISTNDSMIADLKKILKPDGQLYIIEKCTELKKKEHPDCSVPYLTNVEMNDFLIRNNMHLSKSWSIKYKESSGYKFNYTSRYIKSEFKEKL